MYRIQDIVVPIQAAHQAKDTLRNISAIVEYHKPNEGYEIYPIKSN